MMTMEKKYTNRAAGDVVPPLPKVNSLQALTRLRPKRGSEWCTFAFVLNRNMINPDGSLDELHAVVFPLGAFDEQAKAEEHAKNVISITGHPGVIAARYGTPVPLTVKFDPKAVTEVRVDMRGRLIELESSEYRREREEYERQVKLETDIMKEAEEETDPNSIEHFKRQCYLAIKNRANFHAHSSEANKAWENYKKREMAVRDHYASHPDHERDWLPYLREKLIERGELNLYNGIRAAYGEIRDELLGLIDSEDEENGSDIPESPDQSNKSPQPFAACECPDVEQDNGSTDRVPLSCSTSNETYPSGLCFVTRAIVSEETVHPEIASESSQSSSVNILDEKPTNVVCENGICHPKNQIDNEESNHVKDALVKSEKIQAYNQPSDEDEQITADAVNNTSESTKILQTQHKDINESPSKVTLKGSTRVKNKRNKRNKRNGNR